jgi:hypothetical protein
MTVDDVTDSDVESPSAARPIRIVSEVTDSESDDPPPLVSDSEAGDDEMQASRQLKEPKKPNQKKKPKQKKTKPMKCVGDVVWHGETAVKTSPSSSSVSPVAPSLTVPETQSVKNTLEVFSGCGALSDALTRQGFSATQCDIGLRPEDDMADPFTVDRLVNTARLNGTVYTHLAIPCNTYSRARWPRVRSSEFPEGVPELSYKDQSAVTAANKITENSMQLARQLVANGVHVSIENPQTSLLHGSELG